MKQKYFWIDFVKVVAAYAVVILHICVPMVYAIDSPNWKIGNFYNSMVRFSVPVFVMVTGALLLPRTEELGVFLKKRFSRILYPFFFWSIIYLLMKIDFGKPIFEIAKYSFKQIKIGTEFHLWYIYMLIGLYLIIPVLTKWLSKATKKEVVYFLSIWIFVILLDLPIFNKLYSRIDFRYFTGYIGYLLLGYFLAKYHFKYSRWIGSALFGIGFFITVYFTDLLTSFQGSFDGKFYNFLGANIVLAAAGVFLFFKDISLENNTFRNIIEFCSKYTYGIYLSHIFVMDLLTKYLSPASVINIWIGIPVLSLICFALSLFLTFSLSKIPLLGKYISG